MKVLLTGGSGFLGSELCNELLKVGHDVVVLDDHSRGKPARLERFGDQVKLVDGDVRDYNAVKAATEDCEVVWHLAYINGTRYFYEKPDIVLEVGVEGTQNTIKAALECGVRRYVLASTSETYNEPSHVPTTESERLMIPDVTNPRFSYGGVNEMPEKARPNDSTISLFEERKKRFIDNQRRKGDLYIIEPKGNAINFKYK